MFIFTYLLTPDKVDVRSLWLSPHAFPFSDLRPTKER